MMNEGLELRKMNDNEVMAYWSILCRKFVLNVTDELGKQERHVKIMREIKKERGLK